MQDEWEGIVELTWNATGDECNVSKMECVCSEMKLIKNADVMKQTKNAVE